MSCGGSYALNLGGGGGVEKLSGIKLWESIFVLLTQLYDYTIYITISRKCCLLHIKCN